MPLRLDSQSADFSERFRAFLAVKRETAQDVEQRVRHIIAEVKAYGDRALLQLTLEFDRLDLAKVAMRVAPEEIEAAAKACDRQALAALKLARERIEAYHLRQKPTDERFTDALGVELGSRWTAIEAVGLYVPGGTAAYPSSVLMNAVPAKVAGCAAAGHGGAGAGRKAFSLGIGGGQARRRRRNLSHRRRAGGGRARLRHRDDSTRGQDRRARQRLCGGGQAPGVRPGRHRHDRRSLRGAHPRRQDRQSRLDRRRPAGAGRARRQRAIDPDHRRRRARRSSREGGGLRSSRRCRA